jgi:hypothetical protein
MEHEITKPPEGNLTLKLTASERAWVAVDADGKTVLQRVLAAGHTETVAASDSFDVTTGDAAALVLELNGKTLQPLGRRGEVKSVHLTREDLADPGP